LPCKDAFISMKDTACGRYFQDTSAVCSSDDYEDDDDDCFKIGLGTIKNCNS